MGFLSSLSSILGVGKKNIEVIVVGLDNSGKSTILNQLKSPETRSAQIVPTVGYSISTFSTGNFNISAFDMAGQSKYRNVWESYYLKSLGIIFVVDSSDRIRMAVARDELWMILDHKDVMNRSIPIVILANKSDEKEKMSTSDITTALGLDLIRGHSWQLYATCALTGEGIEHALQWFTEHIKKYVDGLV